MYRMHEMSGGIYVIKKGLGFPLSLCFSLPLSLFYTAREYQLVPGAGIEPARLAALDFESSASTSSAIPAWDIM